MKIIVVGLGETGRSLLKMLDGNNHDITVIDKDKKCIEEMTDRYAINGICGSGASIETLKKAGAEITDVFVALTHTDEINMLACMQAKSAGAGYCIARLLMPDLIHESESLKKQYNIDQIICPREELASQIFRNIGLPGFVKIDKYGAEDKYVLDINITEGSPLAGMKIDDIKNATSGKLKVYLIERDRKAVIRKEDVELRIGDGVYAAAEGRDLMSALEFAGIKQQEKGDAVIVGGGITGGYLAEKLSKSKWNVKILDDDLNRCRELMEKFPDMEVAYADGEITEVLLDEKVDKADSVIALTDNDETNLVISMFAWSNGVKSIITRVDRQVHVKLLHQVNIDITVSPTELCVFRVMNLLSTVSRRDEDTDHGIIQFISNLRKF